MPNTVMRASGMRFALLIPCIAFVACAHRQVLPSTPEPELDPTAEVDPDLKALLAGSVLHFDYDATNLDRQNRQRLARIAEYLRDHPEVGLRISGNCDERGTEEYNLMLGQRRADVARQYLTDLGIDDSRIATVSYGKDKPTDDDHDALAWAQNRRDEFEPMGAPRADVVAARDAPEGN